MSDMKWGKGVLGDPVSQREFYRGRVLALEGVLEGSMEIQKQDQDTITRLRKERNEINDDRHEQINQLLEARETLAEANAKIHDLEEWIAGAKGGVMLMYPPRVGPHTEDAYCAHKSRYMASAAALTPYAEGADCVAAGHMEVKQLRHHDQREIARLRIERDNAREMEDTHGDNWEAAQAEVERLRGEVEVLGAMVANVRALAARWDADSAEIGSVHQDEAMQLRECADDLRDAVDLFVDEIAHA